METRTHAPRSTRVCPTAPPPASRVGKSANLIFPTPHPPCQPHQEMGQNDPADFSSFMILRRRAKKNRKPFWGRSRLLCAHSQPHPIPFVAPKSTFCTFCDPGDSLCDPVRSSAVAAVAGITFQGKGAIFLKVKVRCCGCCGISPAHPFASRQNSPTCQSVLWTPPQSH